MMQFQFSDSNVSQQNQTNYDGLASNLRQSFLLEPKHVFTGDRNNTIKQWKIGYSLCEPQSEKLELSKSLQGHSWIENLAFDQEEDMLLVGYRWVLPQKWNLKTNEDPKSVGVPSSFFAWHHYQQKKSLLVATPEGISVINWEDKKTIGFLQNNNTNSPVFRMVTNDKQLLACNLVGTVSLWCLETFKCLGTFSGWNVNTMCFLDPKGTLFAKNLDKEIEIWDAKTNQRLCSQKDTHKWKIHNLIYSSSLNLLFSCGNDAMIKAWELVTHQDENSELILKFEIQNPFVDVENNTMEFLNNEKTQILVGDNKGNLVVMDLKTKNVIWKMENAHSAAISTLIIQ